KVVLMEDPERKAAERRARDLAIQEWQGRLTDDRRKELTRELSDVLEEARGRRGWRVDPKKLAEQRVRDGRFLLFSTDTTMEAREVFDLWSQRGVIEQVFRTGKGELMLGPLRYRSVDHLEAYATVVYLSWLLWAEAEGRLREKFPRETLCGALRHLGDVHWVRLGAKKSLRDWTTELS
ncbi:transposase, partial [mine drainage metagenome]